MIRANELRIGNFVINEMGHKIEVNYNTLCNIVEFEAVYEPIPLAEEWLVRFGFENNSITLKTPDKTLNFSAIVDGFYYPYLDDVFGHSFDLNRIKYVHQLQNLYFALIGQ